MKRATKAEIIFAGFLTLATSTCRKDDVSITTDEIIDGLKDNHNIFSDYSRKGKTLNKSDTFRLLADYYRGKVDSIDDPEVKEDVLWYISTNMYDKADNVRVGQEHCMSALEVALEFAPVDEMKEKVIKRGLLLTSYYKHEGERSLEKSGDFVATIISNNYVPEKLDYLKVWASDLYALTVYNTIDTKDIARLLKKIHSVTPERVVNISLLK